MLTYIGEDEEKLQYSKYFYNEDLSEGLLSRMSRSVSQNRITLKDSNVLRIMLKNQQNIEDKDSLVSLELPLRLETLSCV